MKKPDLNEKIFDWNETLKILTSSDGLSEEEISEQMAEIQIHIYEEGRDRQPIPDTEIVNLCRLALSANSSIANRASQILHEWGFTGISYEDAVQAAHSLEIRAPIGSIVRNIANEDFALALLEIIFKLEKTRGSTVSDEEAVATGKGLVTRPNRFEELLKDYPVIFGEN